MSAFVCGYVLPEGNSPSERLENLTAIQAIARRFGLVIRCGTLEPLPRIVREILQKAVRDVVRETTSFLITTDDLRDVSDSVIDAHDDLVGTSVSLRDAVLQRVEPLRETIQAGFDAFLVNQIIVVTSLGLGDTYPLAVVTPTGLSVAIADAYEREGQVPSFCAIVKRASG